MDREAPFHEIVELAAKPEPFTIRVNPGPPACAEDGLTLLIVGPGAGFPGAAVMVNPALFDAVPFALTVTVALPCEAMRLAATDAVN